MQTSRTWSNAGWLLWLLLTAGAARASEASAGRGWAPDEGLQEEDIHRHVLGGIPATAWARVSDYLLSIICYLFVTIRWCWRNSICWKVFWKTKTCLSNITLIRVILLLFVFLLNVVDNCTCSKILKTFLSSKFGRNCSAVLQYWNV